MAKRGRPSKYTREIASRICARLAAGESLRAVCRDKNMPAEPTVRSWALDDLHGFSAQYTRAREIGYMAMADETLEIADYGVNDTTVDQEGNKRTDYDVINRSKLRVETRKWMLSKMLPKVFGDRLEVDQHTDLTIRDAIDRPPQETREQWLARRQKELGRDPLGSTAGTAD